MRMAIRGALAALALLAGIVGGVPTPAAAQATGTIEGQVVNGTAGGPVPADLLVKVHVVQNRTRAGEHDVRTDGAGRFRVDGLATGRDTIYFPIVEYQGVPYYPEQPIVLDGSAPASVQITVYEATPTPDSLSFERANLLISNVTPTALSIMEMGAVVNGGDRTYAANPELTGSARTLRFTLPPGAIQIAPQAGLPSDTLESTPEGFATTDPIRPGRREIAFSYQLPYDASSLDLTRTFTLPVRTFTLFVPDQGIEVAGPGLAVQGTVELGGQRFRQFIVQNLEPGAQVRFRLSRLPAPFLGRPREQGLAVAGIGGVALLVFVLLAIRRRRAAGAAEAPSEPAAAAAAVGRAAEVTASDVERLRLVRALAELDERYAAGTLDEGAYRAEREAGKRRLVALQQPAPEAR